MDVGHGVVVCVQPFRIGFVAETEKKDSWKMSPMAKEKKALSERTPETKSTDSERI